MTLLLRLYAHFSHITTPSVFYRQCARRCPTFFYYSKSDYSTHWYDIDNIEENTPFWFLSNSQI